MPSWDVKAVGLALVFNRCRMYQELDLLTTSSEEKQLGNWSRALTDGLWCSYFGRGWARADSAFAEMIQYPASCFSSVQKFMEATNGFEHSLGALVDAPVARGSFPRLGLHVLLQFLWRMVSRQGAWAQHAEDDFTWLSKQQLCRAQYTKLKGLGGRK